MLPLPALTIFGKETEPLPQRAAPLGPSHPTEVFGDVAVLQRVADGLRALDWDLPASDQDRPHRTEALVVNQRLPEDDSDDMKPEGVPCPRTRR
ncbi:hypothetical protein [Pseudofrankia sp. DC12]|uniref:hypothetical protein n=1 Tax=Pseudofrankia sp. DC12 TaxID=683315 RepID=UPI0005F7CEA2|nr:hypothetical protein [Pseudofrankia sp. DC12]